MVKKGLDSYYKIKMIYFKYRGSFKYDCLNSDTKQKLNSLLSCHDHLPIWCLLISMQSKRAFGSFS